jgi:hypothetical protein
VSISAAFVNEECIGYCDAWLGSCSLVMAASAAVAATTFLAVMAVAVLADTAEVAVLKL